MGEFDFGCALSTCSGDRDGGVGGSGCLLGSNGVRFA